MGQAAAYFLTFTCYGTRLHGAEPGSVDRDHHIPGSRKLAPDPVRLTMVRGLMNDSAFELGADDRGLVLASIQEVCTHRGWTLLAAHVRSSHVHVVVQGSARPEIMMHAFKAYASRRLGGRRKRWTRHGNTRYLWKDEDVRAAIRYVVEGQGEPMAVYCAWSASC
jgi:REP element-mobilizing transposase RayT